MFEKALLLSRNSCIDKRMQALPPEEFAPILRSPFQKDEYILIVLGSILGAFVGLMQGLYMLQF